jgi:hypothetical protein
MTLASSNGEQERNDQHRHPLKQDAVAHRLLLLKLIGAGAGAAAFEVSLGGLEESDDAPDHCDDDRNHCEDKDDDEDDRHESALGVDQGKAKGEAACAHVVDQADGIGTSFAQGGDAGRLFALGEPFTRGIAQ